MPARLGRWLWLLLLLLGCSGAAEPTPTTAVSPTPLSLLDGYTATLLLDNLQGPTQMIVGPDGRLWLAQLAGAESAGSGQVMAIDMAMGMATGAREVLVDRLQKPTGIAVLDGALWIATETELLRAPLDAEGRPETVETVLTELPNNGRSNGTLTITPDGTLLYETSGRRSGNSAAAGSGVLWELDPADPQNPTPLATGLKNAYAHVYDENGRLWITEIGDGRVEGDDFAGQPPDELNLVTPGADFGWPQCFGEQQPARNRDGTPELCAQTRAPVALFDPQSTPTSIAASPWAADTLLVALWLQQQVVQVRVTPDGDNAAGVVEPFITGFQNPQHLLVLPDGGLLVSDFGRGVVYRIEKTN